MLAIGSGLSWSIPLAAQPDTAQPLQIIPQSDGIRLEWHSDLAVPRTNQFADTGWSEVTLNGLQLPAQLVPLRMPDARPLELQFETITSIAWDSTLTHATVPIPRTETGVERPDLIADLSRTPPSAPVVVLHDGWLRGTRIVVLAVSPIFAAAGEVRMAQQLELLIPGAAPLTATASDLLDDAIPFLTNALPPTNPVVGRALAKIAVTQTGLQRVTGAELMTAGIDLQTLVPARLQLWHQGRAVALEEWRAAEGPLAPTDELRFYAPAPGDRWNAGDTYWLTYEATPGLRMAIQDARPTAEVLPEHTTAWERGIWRDHQLYDPLLPGHDGDHWYAADLRTGPDQPVATLQVPLPPRLPLAAGELELHIGGSAYTAGQRTLTVRSGNATATTTWDGTGNWQQSVILAENGPQVTLTLETGPVPAGIMVGSVAWQRPVVLDLDGQGAAFIGAAGTGRYTLRQTPPGRALYDVSDPAQPIRMLIPDGTSFQFDQRHPTVREYVVSGPGMLHRPAVTRYTPTSLAQPLNANVLYIAPAPLHQALAPLVAQRQAQGYTVAVVDVQAIYDNWSFGQVAPDAIRDFLRYAAATWNRPPLAVTLVGDGTSDPHDYLRQGALNVNFIPPYLAMVDPWMGETACETCYAQLHGAHPVTSADADLFPDLMLGRLPVKSAADLEALVAKIVGYETDPGGSGWRARNLYVADNVYAADGTPDPAGDFVLSSEQSIAMQPPGIQIERLYYDPWNRDSQGRPLAEPWREPDAARARERTHAALNAGAGIVNYTGHSNHWRWARTDDSADNHLLQLYEADTLTNGERLPILLAMTCWTSSFQKPTESGTTLDERLLLNPRGGMVAVWGPTGMGVAHGHDALQRGFYQALWDAPPMTAPLGRLTLAGYVELLTRGGCCDDAVHTFALLGDPLTPARVAPATWVYLPLIRR